VRFRVTKTFIHNGESYSRGDVIDIPVNEAAYLRSRGVIAGAIQQATYRPPGVAAYRVGNSSWYEIDGQKVQGRDEAEKLLREG